MKKIFSVVLIGVLAVGMLFCMCSCKSNNAGNGNASGGGNSSNNSGNSDKGELTGSTFDTGNFTILIPDGWDYRTTEDTMDDFEGDINPNILEIKEGSFSKDNTDTEAVSIVFVPAENRGESDTDAREYYDNVTDQGKIKGEKREWSAFTAETGDAAIEVLQTEINGNYIEVTLYIEDAKSPEPLEDSMILKILDTITC